MKSSITWDFNLCITILSCVITAISLMCAFFQSIQAKKAKKALKSITWNDMQKASAQITRKLIKKNPPAVIYIPNIKSGIMLQFIRNYFKQYIPVVVGHTITKEDFKQKDCNNIKKLEDYWYVDTQKWYAYIPKILLEYKGQNILILDNVSLTGNFLESVTDELVRQGIPRKNIITACVATTEAAIRDKVAPNYYYRQLTDSKTVYMPWA